MHFPYTNRFPEACAIAGLATGVSLIAVLGSRPLNKPGSTLRLCGGILVAALVPFALPMLQAAELGLLVVPILQAAALLVTSGIWGGQRSRGLQAAAVVGQLGLLAISLYVKESEYELSFAYLLVFGTLLGGHLLVSAAPHELVTSSAGDSKRGFWRHDLLIFALAIPLALVVTTQVFDRLTYNGDEIANTFQADVYAHFKAYAPVPPCSSMFWNYWVFEHDGREFSQYTPGWPLFMAPFSRLGLVFVAGPVMLGIVAVAVARLSRRLAWGIGTTARDRFGVASLAGFTGAASAVFGPSMLLNGASRFSHTMVCACFAWAVESLCAVSELGLRPRRAWGYGLLLGSAAALGVATRPADGSTLGIGIFLVFCWALLRRRISTRAFVGTALGFCFFGGLTALILRLQLGAWFQTGYTIAGSIHPEAALRLSAPSPSQIRFSVPLATGAFCWWPAAPALGMVGLVRALGGQQARASICLLASLLPFETFYYFVEFGRGFDDGLGPRYFLPVVVAIAAGTGAALAPVIHDAFSGELVLPIARLARTGPAVLAAGAFVTGALLIAPLMYPIAQREYAYSTTPLRAARKLKLKNAIVMIERGRSTADEWNLAQNPPMDPNPDVLFLIRRNKADEICARTHFPGRTWYRAGFDENLPPYR